MHRPNIFLVGLMAVGKSTVGKLLAETLGMPFYDSDNEIESRSGAEVAWIFDVEGEEGFRDLLWDLVDAGLRVQLGWSRSRDGGKYDGMQPEQIDAAIWNQLSQELAASTTKGLRSG